MDGYDHAAIERKWQDTWAAANAFDTRSSVGSRRIAIKPSSPFTSGELHLGHIRHYTIVDVYARWHRAQGHAVLCSPSFDSFGLPAELGAAQTGLDIEEYVGENVEKMKTAMRSWGFAFDLSWSFSSSDLAHWSEWLFTVLYEAGLIYQAVASVDYCAKCDTAIARSQIVFVDGIAHHERCGEVCEKRKSQQWFLRRLLESYGRDGEGDFLISRQNRWGARIPVFHCENCGPVLSKATRCPRCQGIGHAETDTLDCHFDALWMWIAICVPPEKRAASFDEILQLPELREWLPYALVVGGKDTEHYITSQRSIGSILAQRGELGFLKNRNIFEAELIHEMVVYNGKKISKREDEKVGADLNSLVASYGVDALRLAILETRPGTKIDWAESVRRKLPERCHEFLDDVFGYVHEHCEPTVSHVPPSLPPSPDVVTAKAQLEELRVSTPDGVAAAVDSQELSTIKRVLEEFLGTIVDLEITAEATQECVDAETHDLITQSLQEFLSLLSPLAPHIAAELLEVMQAFKDNKN